MAAVGKTDPILTSPPGYEVIARGRATVDMDAGQPVVIDAAAAATVGYRWDTAYKKATAETFIHGVVVKNVKANGTVEVLMHGEMDGFSGLTPGAALSVVAGNIDSTAPAAGAPIQIVAINATRIFVRV